MVKVTSKIYIHIFTFAMMAVCIFCRRFDIFLFTYAVMTAHESAHLIAAVCIGLKVDKIVFYPFGVNLKLKNKFIHSIADEVILYMAGPLVNCLFALVSAVLYGLYRMPELQLLYVGNIMLFVTNMLPVYPLDGGIILKKIASHSFGKKIADKIMMTVSVIFITALTALCVYMVYITEFNFSIILLTSFLICSLFTQKEKYDTDFVRELMFYKKKSKDKVAHIVADDGEDYKDIAKKFRTGKYSLVYFENKDGGITKIMSENEIMNVIIK